jgi:O-antigen ligase
VNTLQLEDSQKKSVILDNIGSILFALFAFSLPFEIQYSYLVLVATSIFIVLNFFSNRKGKIPAQFWIFQAVYILALSGYFYSSDVFRANYMLERQLTILLFPLLIPFGLNLLRNNSDRILLGLTAGCAVAVLYLLYCAFVQIQSDHQPLSVIFNESHLNQNFALPLSIHASYLSMYISLSLFFILNFIRTKRSAAIWIGAFVVVALLSTGLLLLASRNTIISAGLIILFIFPLYLRRGRIVYILMIILLSISAIVILRKSEYFKTRFSTEFFQEINIKKTKLKDIYVVEPRMQRWLCAINLIEKEPVWGYGTGDEVGLLKQEYFNNKLLVSYTLEFNAHNQYLSTLIKHGAVGLFFFLAAFGYYLFLGISGRDFQYVSFLILLLIGFLTENILDMNKGIFFFAFFNTFFGYQILAKKRVNQTRKVIIE